jgi:hypothetical protein
MGVYGCQDGIRRSGLHIRDYASVGVKLTGEDWIESTGLVLFPCPYARFHQPVPKLGMLAGIDMQLQALPPKLRS